MVASAPILATRAGLPVYISYTEEAKKGASLVVKVTDMLGEEVLVVKRM
jgi:hypothetical protein